MLVLCQPRDLRLLLMNRSHEGNQVCQISFRQRRIAALGGHIDLVRVGGVAGRAALFDEIYQLLVGLPCHKLASRQILAQSRQPLGVRPVA